MPGGLACGPVAGVIYDTYGSLWGAIWGAAGFLLAASLALLMVNKERDAPVIQGSFAIPSSGSLRVSKTKEVQL